MVSRDRNQASTCCRGQIAGCISYKPVLSCLVFPVIESQVSIPLVLGSDFASVIFAQVRCT
ncbi:Fau1 [Kluyveromyces lactis]|nr:Fau1 [Kluyveromyces lactis]